MNAKQENRIEVADLKINKIFQTQIDDTDRDYLCVWMQSILIPWSILRRRNRSLPPLRLEDFNRLNDACIANGGLARRDDKNSVRGYVSNHEKCAEAVGLTGYKKEYVKIPRNADNTFDCSQILALLQWETLVELRDDGRHSLTATGWYKEGGRFFAHVSDPWPKTNDERFDLDRAMTQRKVAGQWIDSRSIESFAWFYKLGTNPKWIE